MALKPKRKHVSYLRVSTDRQGASGLGIEAQRQAVTDFLNGGQWTNVGEFVEVESGRRSDRPELAKAIEACRLYGARLVVAKLDRLSRDPDFLRSLEQAGVEFVAADMPDANKLTIRIMVAVAEQEREAISARTKAALAQKRRFYEGLTDTDRDALKAAGKAVQLGGFRGRTPTSDDVKAAREAVQAKARAQASRLAPVIAELQEAGITSATGIARALTERSIPTARGSERWTTVQVQRVMARISG